MTFKEAFEAMKHGAKVKLPSWAGYWFWCIPAQSILMHTKDGKDIDVRRTECVDYTFTNICSDEWIFADDTNCPALGGMNTFSFHEAMKQVKNKKRVRRLTFEPDMFLQLAYATFRACLDGRREDKFDSEEYSIIKACESKNDSYYTKCEQYVPTQADMLAEDWVFAE